MSCLIPFGKRSVNPLQVTIVEEAQEERETRREGVVVSKSIHTVVHVQTVGDDVTVVRAESTDPVAESKLYEDVINRINLALNLRAVEH